MELWWRCAALEALQAYVMSQLALCTRQEGIKMQKTVASLLQPTLDAIMASPVLQVMAHDTQPDIATSRRLAAFTCFEFRNVQVK